MHRYLSVCAALLSFLGSHADANLLFQSQRPSIQQLTMAVWVLPLLMDSAKHLSCILKCNYASALSLWDEEYYRCFSESGNGSAFAVITVTLFLSWWRQVGKCWALLTTTREIIWGHVIKEYNNITCDLQLCKVHHVACIKWRDTPFKMRFSWSSKATLFFTEQEQHCGVLHVF